MYFIYCMLKFVQQKSNRAYLSVYPLLSCRASLWSSCVVLPLLALTWMSAVLAITDRRSALFQILFAIFDSLEGFVIVMVHCILRREVCELRANLHLGLIASFGQ